MKLLMHTFQILQKFIHFVLVLLDVKKPSQGVKNLDIALPEINAAQ